jgi:hypothetical protein
MSWIRIKLYIVPTSAGAQVTADEAFRFMDQVKNDALYGTYGTLDRDYWLQRMSYDPDSLSEVELIGSGHADSSGLTGYDFELRLNSSLFPPHMGGAQHLFGILAGDLLRFTLPPMSLKTWTVREISFPPDWEEAEIASFRAENAANSIKSIRAAFALPSGRPLLAFSFKPRVGFDLKSLEEAATEVLSSGFNIVELDTRHLPLDRTMLDKLIAISSAMPDRFPKHVARLSLNLSMRSDIAIDAVHELCARCPAPTVIKIDGGFNGFSVVQSVRGKGRDGQRQRDGRKCGPIVTCYPLMQNTLAQYIPADQYVTRLAGSGVDIIYPGARPDIGNMVRSLEGAGAGNQIASVRRYQRLTEKGWPMLSIAGGIYPGQLQAYYELLGPDVAWFLGGGVALHKDGLRAGARLCVEIANESAEKKSKAGAGWSDDISEKLSEQADAMFRDRSLLDVEQLRYVSPKTNLSKVHGLSPRET